MKYHTNPPKWLALALSPILFCRLSTAQAQVVTYDVDIAQAGGGGAHTVDAGTPATGVSVSPTITASGVNTPGALAHSYIWRSWGGAGSTDPTKYFQFTISTDASHQINFSGANATYAIAFGASGSGQSANKWDLHASTDDFASSDIFLSSTTLSAFSTNQKLPVTASLSNLSTVGANVTLTFRLYGWNDISASGAGSGLVGPSAVLSNGGTGANFSVGGVVSAVPEPSTYAGVFGLLALGFVCVNRRFSKA